MILPSPPTWVYMHSHACTLPHNQSKSDETLYNVGIVWCRFWYITGVRISFYLFPFLFEWPWNFLFACVVYCFNNRLYCYKDICQTGIFVGDWVGASSKQELSQWFDSTYPNVHKKGEPVVTVSRVLKADWSFWGREGWVCTPISQKSYCLANSWRLNTNESCQNIQRTS